MRGPAVLLALLVLVFAADALAVSRVEAKGLMANAAVLVIDGRQRLLKAGATSPEGVTLVRANSREAVVRFNDVERTLTLSRSIASGFVAAQEAQVQLERANNGHYYSTGSINGGQVRFMVDTGATTIALSSLEARRLGVDYQDGRTIQVSTASGVTQGHLVLLPTVSVGGIELHQVEAMVLEGPYPSEPLLGNSFLNRLTLEERNGVLTLIKKY